MPRTARTRSHARGRILAVAGAAAALAGAGTAAATSASAAAVPAAGLSGHAKPAVLTAARSVRSPLAPAKHAAPKHAAAKHAAVEHAAVEHAAVTAEVRHAAGHAVNHAPASHRTARHAHAPAHARPYQMYDSVTPSAIPGGKAVATYADGPYAASPSQLAGRNVTWIDTNGSDPKGANVLDVEPGDATPTMAATWAGQRLTAHPHGIAVIYTMRSEWPATQAAIAGLPTWQQHHVRYWIADPTGVPHLVPGSSATQWYWGTNYDISTVNPGF